MESDFLSRRLTFGIFIMGAFNTITEIIEDLKQGKLVIVVDDADRENEGDLIMAASFVRPQDINFMAKFGRGLICVPMKSYGPSRMTPFRPPG